MTIVIVMENNLELKVKCKNFKMTKNKFTGDITGLDFEGMTENEPLYLPIEKIKLIYRVMSDEKDGE